jgi:hypothetical protein
VLIFLTLERIIDFRQVAELLQKIQQTLFRTQLQGIILSRKLHVCSQRFRMSEKAFFTVPPQDKPNPMLNPG